MSRPRAAELARALAQGLTGWGLVAHLASGPGVSPFVVGFGAAALLVTLRGAGDARGRAVGCFAGAGLLAGLLLTSLWLAALGLLLGMAPSDVLTTWETLLLVASVLFAMAGAFYWTQEPA